MVSMETEQMYELSLQRQGKHEGAASGTVWVAYYSDMSSVVVFTNEVEALRYAVAHKMECKAYRSGDEVGT